MQTHYEVLGVSKECTSDEIKRAYRRIALKYHPDKGSSNVDLFKRAVEAHEVLSDPSKRMTYDSDLGASMQRTASSDQRSGSSATPRARRRPTSFAFSTNFASSGVKRFFNFDIFDDFWNDFEAFDFEPFSPRGSESPSKRARSSPAQPPPRKPAPPPKSAPSARRKDKERSRTKRERIIIDLTGPETQEERHEQTRAARKRTLDLNDLAGVSPLTQTDGNFDMHSMGTSLPEQHPSQYNKRPRLYKEHQQPPPLQQQQQQQQQPSDSVSAALSSSTELTERLRELSQGVNQHIDPQDPERCRAQLAYQRQNLALVERLLTDLQRYEQELTSALKPSTA